MNYLLKFILINVVFWILTLFNFAIIIYNFKGFIVMINKKAANILGYNKSELKHQSFLKIVPPEQIPKNLEHFEQIINKEPLKKGFLKRIKIDKHRRRIEIKVKTIPINNVYSFVSIIKPSGKEQMH